MDTNKIFQSKKMQKLLKNKKIRGNLEQQLRKSTGMKNASLEEIMSSDLPKQHKKMIDDLLSNPIINRLKEQFLNKENLKNIKNIFLELIDKDEIKNELDKFRCIINEDKFTECLSNIYSEFQKTNDIKSLEKILKENEILQEIIGKFEKSLKDNVINLENIQKTMGTFVTDFFIRIKQFDIIKDSDIKNLKKMTSQFDMLKNMFNNIPMEKSNELKEEKKKKRRFNARKKYRRKLRSQYKKNKSN
jgi:hypothetical protein